MYATAEPERTLPDLLMVHTKIAVVKSILAVDEQTLVIGRTQISSTSWAPRLGAPVIQGSLKDQQAGTVRRLPPRQVTLVNCPKVANASIDLPGKPPWRYRFRGIRPARKRRGSADITTKADGGGAIFYSVVARDWPGCHEYAAHRQRF